MNNNYNNDPMLDKNNNESSSEQANSTLDNNRDEVSVKNSENQCEPFAEFSTPQSEPIFHNSDVVSIEANCKFDKTKDEKFKKIFSYSSIPFFLAGIAVSMFNMGRVRHPLSFLLISIALFIFSIQYIIRYTDLKKCNCPVCIEHAKVSIQFFALILVIAVAILGAFIYFAVKA